MKDEVCAPLLIEIFGTFLIELDKMVSQYVLETKKSEFDDILDMLFLNITNSLNCMEMILCSKEKNISTAKLKEQLCTSLKIN